MLIMPNQENEWVHQVVRDIPSPTSSNPWEDSDSQGENVIRSSRVLGQTENSICRSGRRFCWKQKRPKTRELAGGYSQDRNYILAAQARTQFSLFKIGITIETGALGTDTSSDPLSSRAVCVLSLRSETSQGTAASTKQQNWQKLPFTADWAEWKCLFSCSDFHKITWKVPSAHKMRENMTKKFDTQNYSKKMTSKKFKFFNRSITLGRGAYFFCFQINKFNIFQSNFSKSTMKPIKFLAAALFRSKSSSFLQCLLGNWYLVPLEQLDVWNAYLTTLY